MLVRSELPAEKHETVLPERKLTTSLVGPTLLLHGKITSERAKFNFAHILTHLLYFVKYSPTSLRAGSCLQDQPQR